MSNSNAERGRPTPRGEAPSHLMKVLPLYGRGSWRERHDAIFSTDAQLRWAVEQHRDEIVAAGALALFRGRVFVVEPDFSALMLAISRREIGMRQHERQRLAQRDAESAFKSGD